MSRIVFLDEALKKRFYREDSYLHKFVKKKHITSDCLFFANPFNGKAWKDPYERWYIDRKYEIDGEIKDYKYKDRLLCFCLTSNNHSEPAWTTYGTTRTKAIRLKVNLRELLKILQEQTEYDVFIGMVQYVSHSEMTKSSPPRCLGMKKSEFLADDLSWLKLFFLKRKAFDYEKEIRIVLVSKEQIDREKEKGRLIRIPNRTDLYKEACFLPGKDKGKNEMLKRKLAEAGFRIIKEEDLYFPIDENKTWHIDNRVK